MKSRLLILTIFLLSIAFVGQAFAASTLVPYPVKAPKGAYVNGSGVNADDNFFWQMLTLTTVDAAHTGGSGFTFNMPTDMTVADVNNDGNYTGEISAVWNDAALSDLTGLTVSGVNATHSSIYLTLGNQYVSNGSFTGNATGWTNTGAAYNAAGGGVLRFTAGAATAQQNVYAVPGQTYTVNFTVSGYTAGTLTASIGGVSGTTVNADGSYSQIITATSTGALLFTSNGAFAGDVDNVAIVPNKVQNGQFATNADGWATGVTGSGWAYNATKIAHTPHVAAVVDTLSQDAGIISGRNYTVTFTVAWTAGSVTPVISGVPGTAVGASGTYTQNFAAPAAGSLKFAASNDFNGTIDNIFLVEDKTTNGGFPLALGTWTPATGSVSPESIRNGSFATVPGAEWVGGVSTWDLTGGNATVPAGGAATLTQPIVPALVNGAQYTLSYTYTTTAGGAVGNISVALGGGAAATTAIAVGANTVTNQIITAAATGNIVFTFPATFGGSIDNISLKPSIVSNGIIAAPGTGWAEAGAGTHSIVGNNFAVTVAGAGITLTQTIATPLVASKAYNLTYKYTATAGASIGVTLAGGVSVPLPAAFVATGVQQTIDVVINTPGALVGSDLVFTVDGAFVGTIDDVTLTGVRVTAAPAIVAGAVVLDGGSSISSAAFSPVVAASQTYTVSYDVTAISGGFVNFTLGGITGVTRTAAGHYVETITTTGAGDLTFSENSLHGGGNTVTLDNITVVRNDANMAIGDKVYVMVPVETSGAPSVASDDWWVDFTDGASDDIGSGSGTAITYVTPGPTALSLVTFADNMSADNDTTNALGDRYPTSASAMWSALPDFVVDGTGTAFSQSPNVGIALNGTEGGTESLYAVWVSTSSNLAHVDSLTSGVSFAAKYTDLKKYLVDEGDTGGVQFALGGFPEGAYYFYVTSYLTGDFVLGRSGKVVVRHWPVINLVGYDYDHDALYTPGATNDDKNVTLDSGSYFDYSGTQAYTGQFTDLSLYTSVDDLDDNATVSLFYSTSSSLDSSKVLRSGSPVDGTLVITGLTDATAIASNLLENSEDDQGYIKSTWQVHPDSTGVVLPAQNYTIYAVSTDGKHFDITALKGSGSTSLTTSIKHSPNLTLDQLAEYDTGVAAGTQIDVKSMDTIMLSWGKNGINGALDFDDSAVISFYIRKDADGAANTNSDYNHAGYRDATNTIWNDAATTPTTTHRISTGLQENYDSKGNMYYAWNLKEDFNATGWYPTAGYNYFLYAVIDENKSGGTVRCVTLGTVTAGSSASYFLNPVDVGGPTDLAGYEIQFTNTPFTRLTDPPAEGVTVNAEETYRMRFNAFDWDTDADMGIFAVKNTSTGFADGPMTTSIAALDTLGSTAYMLNDNDGDYHSGNVAVAENSSAYYDATIRVPGVATYTTKMNGIATQLGDGTYWVYIGSTKETSFANKVTNTAGTDWTLAGALWAGGVLTITGDAPNQNVSVVAGRSYMVSYTVTGNVGATLTMTLGGDSGVATTRNGTYHELIDATSAAVLTFTGVLGTVEVSNISVVPYATLYRAPGPLTVVNSGVVASQRNLAISPMEATVAQGDTVSFSIRGADNGADIDRMDTYVAVEKNYWTLVNSTTPFTASLAFTGKLIANSVIDDAANNRWILRSVVFDAGNPLTLDDTGLGTSVATVRLVSKGTASALQEVTSIYYVNEPVAGRVTKFSNNGSDISINSLSSTVKVVPRPIVEGIVELQGRNDMRTPVTFELRKRGSYALVSDSLFTAMNDANPSVAGIQYTPDSDGKFTFTKLPIGEFDLVATYSRYLSKLVQVNVYPGLDTLFVSFGTLKGGDAIGYTDSLTAVYPDNAIDAEDINRITAAFLADTTNAKWNDGVNNWKWADIDENGVVETPDISMATANFGTSGANPVYKTAGQPVASNMQSMVEFSNVPSSLKAGDKYTIQVVARNTSGVRAYFVNMNYNTNILSFNGIRKGDFISSESHSFPVVKAGSVGLTNAVFGDEMFSGDGILAEITFTALNDGVFSSDMLSFEKVEFVNGNFMKEDLVDNTTGIKGNAPAVFALGQNFPNPFNPSTTIGFTLPEVSKVSVDIYDILGRHVRTLVAGSYAAGKYSVVWDARDANGYQVSTGIYIYKIKAGNFSSVKRMAFMK